jgi:hypothetical protein
MSTSFLACDGCGQPASPEHIGRRLQRLEWGTRYRPIHIATLLLSAISPDGDAEFLYAGQFQGEAARVLECVGTSPEGKSVEAVLAEFQRGGHFLTHVLECPLELTGTGSTASASLLTARAPTVAARIRRSLKPKRVILVSGQLAPVLESFSSSELGCPVILDGGKPFALDGSERDGSFARLRQALAATATAR